MDSSSANAQFAMACLTRRSDKQIDTTILLSNSTCIQVSSSSERSIYRYKAYYDKLREAADNDSGN